MKYSKFAVAIAAASLSSASMAAVVLNEGFNSVAGLAGAGWTIVNASPNPNTSWFQGNTAVFNAAAGPNNSYVAANFEAGSPSINNWLLTPTLAFAGSTSLSFSVRNAGDGFLDTIEVYLSTNGASSTLSDFSTLLGTFSGTTDLGWIAQNYSTSFSGSGRIGFRYVVADSINNGNYVGIDSVVVDTVGSTVPEPTSLALVGLAVAGMVTVRRRRPA